MNNKFVEFKRIAIKCGNGIPACWGNDANGDSYERIFHTFIGNSNSCVICGWTKEKEKEVENHKSNGCSIKYHI